MFGQSKKQQNNLNIGLQIMPHAQNLSLPSYATEQSAGLDLSAAIDTQIQLAPGQRTLVPTGIAIALPPGYEAQIRPRSGLAAKNGVTVLNTPAPSTPITAARSKSSLSISVRKHSTSNAACVSRK
jgi:hypothetical protein